MLKIDVKKNNNTFLISLSGSCVITHIKKFDSEFKKHLEQKPEEIIINMKNVPYIDSYGIGSLLRCANLAENNKINLYFSELSKQVESIFKISKLDSYLKILSDEELDKKMKKLQN